MGLSVRGLGSLGAHPGIVLLLLWNLKMLERARGSSFSMSRVCRECEGSINPTVVSTIPIEPYITLYDPYTLV